MSSIQTLTDWNTRLIYCGCCAMPVCPEPAFVYQKMAYSSQFSWYVHRSTIPAFLSDRRDDYSGGGYTLKRYVPDYDTARLGGDTIGNAVITTVESVPPLTGGTTTTYENIITEAEMNTANANAFAFLASALDWDNPSYTKTATAPARAHRANHVPPISQDVILLGNFYRFRFRIPTTHQGSKFFITYDVAEFPEDGDPSYVSEDNVIEWTGPGTGSSGDPSWLTAWVELAPPEVSGERRVVNIRYTCYSGAKYGAKPQVMGEAFTPPAP